MKNQRPSTRLLSWLGLTNRYRAPASTALQRSITIAWESHAVARSTTTRMAHLVCISSSIPQPAKTNSASRYSAWRGRFTEPSDWYWPSRSGFVQGVITSTEELVWRTNNKAAWWPTARRVTRSRRTYICWLIWWTHFWKTAATQKTRLNSKAVVSPSCWGMSVWSALKDAISHVAVDARFLSSTHLQRQNAFLMADSGSNWNG